MPEPNGQSPVQATGLCRIVLRHELLTLGKSVGFSNFNVPYLKVEAHNGFLTGMQ